MVQHGDSGNELYSLLLVGGHLGQDKEFRSALERAGFHVEWVPDGTSAFQRAQALHLDLLVSELLLPELDGLSLCRALKSDARTARIPVLLCSIVSVGDRAREAGAAGFLRSPTSEARLLQQIALLIPSARATVAG